MVDDKKKSTSLAATGSMFTPEGKLNIRTRGMRRSLFGDFYFLVMDASWWQFILGAALTYSSLNALFASFYYFGGNVILNATPNSYFDAYIFSF